MILNSLERQGRRNRSRGRSTEPVYLYYDQPAFESNRIEPLDDSEQFLAEMEMEPLHQHELMMMYPSSLDGPFSSSPPPQPPSPLPEKVVNKTETEVGIYGWRKKATYILLGCIVLLVGLNAALTFWIVSFLGFTSNGISSIDLSNDELITFKGNAIFDHLLFATEVSSYKDNQLKFVTKNGPIQFRSIWEAEQVPKVSLNQTQEDSNSSNRTEPDLNPDSSDRTLNGTNTKLTLTHNRVVMETGSFEVRNRKSEVLFALAEDPVHRTPQLTMKVDNLQIKGKNSLGLLRALQTPLLQNAITDELKLMAPMGRVRILGPVAVAIESKLGDASVIAFEQVKMLARGGKITLESATGVYLRRLPTPNGTTVHRKSTYLIPPEVYQVCICAHSGRLFLVHPNGLCAVASHQECR